MFNRMRFIIKSEPAPNTLTGTIYRAFFENGHSAHISALSEADLILKLKDFYNEVEIVQSRT